MGIDQKMNRQRRRRKDHSINAVLSEQFRQDQTSCLIDISLIADVYRSSGSMEAQSIANKKAFYDELIASNIAKKSNKLRIKIFKRPSKLRGILFPKKRKESGAAA